MKKTIIILLILASFTKTFTQSKSNTEKYLINLSAQKFTYMHPDSLDKLQTVLDDRLVYIHSSGLVEGKVEMIADIKAGKWMLRKVDIKKPAVRVFKGDLAILNAEGHFFVTAPDGQKDMNLLYTEVWAKYKAGWKLISRHASKVE